MCRGPSRRHHQLSELERAGILFRKFPENKLDSLRSKSLQVHSHTMTGIVLFDSKFLIEF